MFTYHKSHTDTQAQSHRDRHRHTVIHRHTDIHTDMHARTDIHTPKLNQTYS